MQADMPAPPRPRNDMPHRRAAEVLDESYLDVRAKLLEVAATLDRIDRAEESAAIVNDARRGQIDHAIAILSKSSDEAVFSRATQIQQLFSRPYEADWRKTMEV